MEVTLKWYHLSCYSGLFAHLKVIRQCYPCPENRSALTEQLPGRTLGAYPSVLPPRIQDDAREHSRVEIKNNLLLRRPR